MKQFYILSSITILFYSCNMAKVHYIGSKNNPTQKVDVFVDEAAIKKPYEIIGKGYAQASWRSRNDQEKILEKAIEKARKNGADAIFYKEIFIPATGTNINTYTRTDSLEKSLVTNSNTSVSPVYGYFHKEMLFLKYK